MRKDEGQFDFEIIIPFSSEMENLKSHSVADGKFIDLMKAVFFLSSFVGWISFWIRTQCDFLESIR